MEDCGCSKGEGFEGFFFDLISIIGERNYTTTEAVNALACSMSLLVLESEDPSGYLRDITRKMNLYVRSIESRTEAIMPVSC